MGDNLVVIGGHPTGVGWMDRRYTRLVEVAAEEMGDRGCHPVDDLGLSRAEWEACALLTQHQLAEVDRDGADPRAVWAATAYSAGDAHAAWYRSLVTDDAWAAIEDMGATPIYVRGGPDEVAAADADAVIVIDDGVWQR